MTAYDAMVLAGGGARRLGGADKPALLVGGRSLLDRVLAACPDAGTTVVVGPWRETVRDGVRWTREQPPGGGPVAAVAAGLGYVTADRVLLLAADLPFLDRPTVIRLLAALGDAPEDPSEDPDRPDAALLVDAAGRDQPLAAAYRTAALRASLAALGDPAGLPLRRLTAPLHTVRLADPAGVAYDCDTWEELAQARERERAESRREGC
ncbi:molybdopterin-guanine dinucleotide biosynthesis protein A [Kitasatospora sp. MAP5-34]|nr:molybdopterin-guanine dinucleotide biosynthesis protein A [Kitasatospora sp. MAP5-34]